jgi:SAM-dependent methyltransferase/methyltransferase-like protein
VDPHGTPTSYDDHPYRSRPCPHLHPANLAMVARLLGQPPPELRGARVLELGCGTGTNLIPMAEDLPEAEFVGVDLAAKQIEICQRQADALGLRNVTFRAMDLREVTPALGTFDYILAHGMYCWVPAPVREQILRVCGEQLSERGLAFISYNTYPGWRMTGALRDLLLFHLGPVQGLTDPAARAAGVEAGLDLLIEGVTERSNSGARFLQGYAQRYKEHLRGLGPLRDSALHHDILGDVNEPVYFRDFAAHAAKHGLSFLSESPPALSMPVGTPEKVKAALGQLCKSDEDMEQYADFLQMRSFRQSVLRRAGGAPRSLRPEHLVGLHVRACLRPASGRLDGRALATTRVERFLGPEGASISSNHPVSKAALCELAERWPASLEFTALLQAARARLGGRSAPAAVDLAGTSADAQELGGLILRALLTSGRNDLIFLRADGPAVARNATAAAAAERPVARPLCRLEALSGPLLTNLYHEAVLLTPLQRLIVPLLDGTRDRRALLAVLTRLAEEGTLEVERGGKQVSAAQRGRALEEDLDACLRWLCHYAILKG